ncbi:hypothetical protein ABT369_55455 [Dactylosporangium sp. NPDC000244]|uniref:hypothetical protein n=1 Tax=Dactylosporangium sp. NPDC000244 TaxID=3154365 RepID=UPI003328F125
MFVRERQTTAVGSAALILLVLLTPVVALGLVLTGVRYVMHLSAVHEVSDGICGTEPGKTLVGPLSPYGRISRCEVLDHGADAWGDRDGSVSVLLTTDQGLVALRIDYADLGGARWYRSEGHELEAADAPDVHGATQRRLAEDIRSRGGVRATPWTLSAGDG